MVVSVEKLREDVDEVALALPIFCCWYIKDLCSKSEYKHKSLRPKMYHRPYSYIF